MEKLTSKEILPISGSKLYDSYLLPCRPIGTEDTVDIKKSSYKKVFWSFFKKIIWNHISIISNTYHTYIHTYMCFQLTKFLKAIEKKGVIKLKEQRGEIYLCNINWEHDE